MTRFLLYNHFQNKKTSSSNQRVENNPKYQNLKNTKYRNSRFRSRFLEPQIPRTIDKTLDYQSPKYRYLNNTNIKTLNFLL